jgi:hypothetical protein
MPLADGDSPDARQVPPWQQPPPEQVLPGQHASPEPPHEVQTLLVQAPPVEQVPASATHMSLPGSQQPELQVLLAQHG